MTAYSLYLAGMARSKHQSKGFAERLRSLRKQKDLSQTELGHRADVHYTHISRYERGASMPSSETLRGLAEALGVSADYLMEGYVEDAAKASFNDRDLLRQFREAEKLADDDKYVVKKLLDAFLLKKQIDSLSARS